MESCRRNSREKQSCGGGCEDIPAGASNLGVAVPTEASRSPGCIGRVRYLLVSKAAAWSLLGARSWLLLNLEAGSYRPAGREGTICSCTRIPPTASRTAGTVSCCLLLASQTSSLGHSFPLFPRCAYRLCFCYLSALWMETTSFLQIITWCNRKKSKIDKNVCVFRTVVTKSTD